MLESLDLPVPEPTPAAVTGNSAAAVFDPEPPELFPVPSVVELYEQKEESEDEAETDAEGVVDLWEVKDFFSLTVRCAQKVTAVAQASTVVNGAFVCLFLPLALCGCSLMVVGGE